MSEKTWKFAVFVSSATGNTKCFGTTQTYEEAVKQQQSALSEGVGWKFAAIFDTSLNEVKEKP